jgi:V8-like Glu-specific endopeptidase
VLEQREVLTLSPVAAGSAGAFRDVVELQATFPDNKSFVGTGALIDGFHVLTAGHLLYSAQDGGYATSVKVTPELSGGKAPFGVAFGTFERVDPSWVNFSRANPDGTSPKVADIGLVTLNRAIGYTTGTGWFTLAYNNNNAFFANAPFLTAGYPAIAGVNGAQMYFEMGRAMGASSTNGIAFHQSDLSVLSGQSGSPVWQTTPRGGALLYGVVTGANGFTTSSISFAARITQAVYSELMAWERVDRMPAVYSGVTMASQVRLQHPAVTVGPVKTTGTPAIMALSNYTDNLNCVIKNFFSGNWYAPDGYSYYPKTWEQMYSPAPSNCIYYDPYYRGSNYSSYYDNYDYSGYSDYGYNDYGYDDYYY